VSDLTGVLIDGRYEIHDLLARGGMATVYTALDTRLDRIVAVKVMHSHLAQDEEYVSRFIREAKAAASLTHPNVIAVHDQGWHQGGPPAVFLVMEYVEGPTLRDILRERGKMSVDEALDILEEILAGIGAAHRAGIVHRDIKPENVILADDGRIKVADFGLARELSSGSTLTADAGLVMGSISYLSPEQVERGVADARSDVYASGIILFELLTGKKPFEGESAIQVAYKHVNDDVPLPSSLNANVPPAVDALVRRATARDADMRPRDASIFLREVKSVREGDHSPALISPPPVPPATPVINETHPSPVSEIAMGESNSKKSKRMSTPKVAGPKRPKQKRTKRNRAIAALVAIALGGWLWYVTVGPGASVASPSLLGLSIDEATQEAQAAGLKIQIKSRAFDEQIPQDHVITSSPAGGAQVDKGSTISIVVSKGAERFVIPTLTGLSLAEATNALSDLNLKLSTLAEEYDATIPLGYIISSTPAAGQKVKRSTVVKVVVSKGVEQISILSYVNKSGDQALSDLTDAGAKVVSKNVFSDTVAPGLVVAQNPDGPANIEKGAKVTISISKGPALIKVPNLVKMTTELAKKTLEDAGFNNYKINILKSKGPGKVVGQTPKAGSMVKPGTLIVVDIY
jgi:serine/threonine-protein kinase